MLSSKTFFFLACSLFLPHYASFSLHVSTNPLYLRPFSHWDQCFSVCSLQPRHVVDFLLSGGIFPHIAWKSLKKSHLQHYKDTFMAILKHCVCIEMTQVTYEKNPAFLPRTSSYHPRFHFQVNSSAVKSFEDVKSFVLQLCAPDVIVTVSWPRHFLEFSPPHHYPSFLLMFRTVVKNLSKRLILSASISDRNR